MTQWGEVCGVDRLVLSTVRLHITRRFVVTAAETSVKTEIISTIVVKLDILCDRSPNNRSHAIVHRRRVSLTFVTFTHIRDVLTDDPGTGGMHVVEDVDDAAMETIVTAKWRRSVPDSSVDSR